MLFKLTGVDRYNENGLGSPQLSALIGNRLPSIRDEVAMRMVVIFALALLCAPAGLFGQALHPDSLFPRLVGRWVLRGTIARQQTVHDVTFEWLLGREYLQIH